jgi:hypothetical protein
VGVSKEKESDSRPIFSIRNVASCTKRPYMHAALLYLLSFSKVWIGKMDNRA